MDINEQTISKFYTAFQQKDYTTMNSCYTSDVVFFDPVFELLQANEAKAMWEMLCKSARNFSLQFGNIQNLDDGYYTCDWEAHYTFSKTGRPVINKVKAHMRMDNGLIAEHSDGFSIHKWSKQALGFSGWLLGWNSFFQRKIKNTAKRSLLKWREEAGCWMLDAGCWMLDAGCWMLDAGYWILDTGCWIPGYWIGVQDFARLIVEGALIKHLS